MLTLKRQAVARHIYAATLSALSVGHLIEVFPCLS